MVLKLYRSATSAPSRAVVYTLEALRVPYETIHIDLVNFEQKKEYFIKINPQHTLPTIEDEDGFIFWDSHAINVYLVTKYGKDDKLYPKDVKTRAIVDQRLHFHNSVLLVSLKKIINSIFVTKHVTKIIPELKQVVEEALSILETFLSDGRHFVAGNNCTIADFSIATTITNITVFMPFILERYPLVEQYYKRNESVIPDFQETETKVRKSIREILLPFNFEYE